MEIFRIAAIALVTMFCVLILRDVKSELAIIVAFSGGIIVLLSVIDYFYDIFSVINDIANRAGIASSIILLLFKIISIGYVTEFSSSLIEDTGLTSLAEKVIFAGKILIVVASLPIVVKLFDYVVGLLQ